MTHDVIQEARERLRDGGRLLVTRLRYIGDVVLSLSLVHALRESFPAAALHYLAEPAAIEVLERHPDIDRVWCLEPGTRRTLKLVAALRRQQYAAVIDLFSNPRSAVLVRATGCRLRIGEARRVRRHLYTVQRHLRRGPSALQQHLEAAAILGVPASAATPPRIHLSDAERQRGVAALREDPPGAAATVLLHLGASQPAKEWPRTQALQLVRRLARRGIRVLLSTAPACPQPSAAVAERAGRAARLLPCMPLRELLGIVAAADAVVSVDGALVHSSVALERPTLALFGPTDPRIWFPYPSFGPYRVLHAGVDCSTCDRKACPERTCMREIGVDLVERHVQALLDAVPSAPGTPAT